jgi:imidazolonepropionase
MSDLNVIPDGAVLVRNGYIEDVGPTRRLERLKTARDAEEVDATGAIVIPAFVDNSTRPIGLSGASRRASAEQAIEKLLAGMARHGTLTAEVLADFSGEPAGAVKRMRHYASLQGRPLTLITSLVLSGQFPIAFEGDAAQWTRLMMVHLLATASSLRLAQSVTVMIGNAGIGNAGIGATEARLFLDAARAAQIRAKIQTAPECSEQAAGLALESNALVVNGLEGPLPKLCRALASSPAILTLAPAVTYAQQRDSFAPARELIDAGAAVALATNFSPEVNWDYDMLHSMAIACRFTGISPAEAIIAATINAAHAAGCAEQRGSIEPGKVADLVLFDCPDYCDLIRGAAVHQVLRVIRRGRTVYRRGSVGETD